MKELIQLETIQVAAGSNHQASWTTGGAIVGATAGGYIAAPICLFGLVMGITPQGYLPEAVFACAGGFLASIAVGAMIGSTVFGAAGQLLHNE